MNGILENENTVQADVSESRRPEISEDRAKLTGLVCIGCAAAAVMFSFLSSILFFDLSVVAMILYFAFLLASAAFGVFGYSEIKAVRSGWVNSIFQLFTVVFLCFLLLSVSGKPTTQFAVTYGIFAVCVPLILTVLTLAANKTAVGKSLAPLAVPVLHAFAYLLFGSAALLFVLPLGWALLGLVAYSGRR